MERVCEIDEVEAEATRMKGRVDRMVWRVQSIRIYTTLSKAEIAAEQKKLEIERTSVLEKKVGNERPVRGRNRS
jgi:hypothetical protein